jgi:hypothetical protein
MAKEAPEINARVENKRGRSIAELMRKYVKK